MNIKELRKKVLDINRKASAGQTVRIDLLIDKKDLPSQSAAALGVDAGKSRTAATLDFSAKGAEKVGISDFSPQSAAALTAVEDREIIDLNAIKLSAADKKENNLLLTKATHASKAVDGVPDVKLTQKEVSKWWILVEECSYTTRDFTLVAPKDYETDLASIPRFLWSIIAPFELSLPAPLFHDLIYRRAGKMIQPQIDVPHDFTRKEADDIFLELMEKKKVPVWKRTLAYWAVRGLADFAWKLKP